MKYFTCTIQTRARVQNGSCVPRKVAVATWRFETKFDPYLHAHNNVHYLGMYNNTKYDAL